MNPKISPPKDKGALLSASPEQLERWSQEVELPDPDEQEFEVDALLLEAFLHRAPEEEPQASGLWTPLRQWWGSMVVLAPAASVAALALFWLWTPPLPVPSPAPRDALTEKGSSPRAELQILRSMLGQRSQGSFIKPGASLAQHQTFSLEFRTLDAPGHIAFFWHRKGEPMALLHRYRKKVQKGKKYYVKKGQQIVKYPLKGEKPGLVCIVLLQTRAPLGSGRLKLLQKRQPKGQWDRWFSRQLKQQYLTSAHFCFAIQGARRKRP